MKFWIRKENDADPGLEWKDSYILTLNRDSGSTIYSGYPGAYGHPCAGTANCRNSQTEGR